MKVNSLLWSMCVNEFKLHLTKTVLRVLGDKYNKFTNTAIIVVSNLIVFDLFRPYKIESH